MALLAAAAGCGSDDDETGTDVATDTTATGGTEPFPSPTVTFVPDEAHAALPPAPGCDQLFFHATMAMFNPSLADELLLYDCPFPYDPAAISMDGGAEDPSIAAPYEPHRYQELFDVMTAERIGFCAFSRVAEPSVRGFVYGFTVAAKPETCAGNDPTIEVVVREYASRAHRDEAANTLAAPVVQAFGRFTITIDGSDAAAVDRLAAAFVALGVHQVRP